MNKRLGQEIKLPGEITDRIRGFLEEIGLPVVFARVAEDTFLPGILVDRGKLVIDIGKLKYPGDILHEAGHMAIMQPEERLRRYNDISIDGGDEMGAIAWSWAALKYLDLPPESVFHAEGYKDDSQWLIELFSGGSELGVPLLQWMGLTLLPGPAKEAGTRPFPNMQKWLRD